MRLKLPVALLLASLAAPSWGAGEFYCCNDPVTGRRTCGDALPAACRTQAHKVFDKGGNLLREVAAPLTAEQKAAQREQALRQKQLEAAQREQRRLDQALLDTYGKAGDIDLAQTKAEQGIKSAMQAAQEKIIAAQKSQQKWIGEAEFYKRSTPPPTIDANLRTVNREIQVQQELLEKHQKELTALQARFDNERLRYQELTGRNTGSRPTAITPPASPSASR
jgi:hypothetical protein